MTFSINDALHNNLYAIMLSVVVLRFVMLSVVMLCVIMLNVVAPFFFQINHILTLSTLKAMLKSLHMLFWKKKSR
jgi:hypothetical protein